MDAKNCNGNSVVAMVSVMKGGIPSKMLPILDDKRTITIGRYV